jgi:cytochrome-b5 reductase
MLAGGSGITPMLQVVKEIVNNPEDHTTVHLVFANNTTEDILLRKEIDELVAKHSNLKVSYVVAKLDNSDRASFAGNVYEGYVSEKVIADTMPTPSSDSRILVCGPPGFMDAISGNKTPDYQQGLVSGLLKKAGYDETMVFKF